MLKFPPEMEACLNFKIHAFNMNSVKHNYNDKVKEDEIGRTCRMQGGEEESI
jgi:hypothetical protein